MKSMILLGMALSLLSACNTVEGFGQDLRSAGNAIERTADETKPR